MGATLLAATLVTLGAILYLSWSIIILLLQPSSAAQPPDVLAKGYQNSGSTHWINRQAYLEREVQQLTAELDALERKPIMVPQPQMLPAVPVLPSHAPAPDQWMPPVCGGGAGQTSADKKYKCQVSWFHEAFDRIFPPSSDATAAAPTALQAADEDPIDFVVAWSGPSSYGNNVRERDNGEMVYLLRSIAQHAPWFHHVWIIVNGKATLPLWVPKSMLGRIDLVDRCGYMPRGTCPSKNSHQIQMYAHHIPGLAEQYVIAEDDIFLGQPVLPTHFYESPGVPWVYRKGPSWGGQSGIHRLYAKNRVSFDTPKSTAPSPHYYYPMLKSVARSIERKYPEYFAFAMSHKEGRYNSHTNDYRPHSMDQEECWYGIMNAELLQTGTGVYRDIDGGSDRPNEWHAEHRDYSKAGFNAWLSKRRPVFLNVNDRFQN